ncbi:hypothetical protein, partial [Pseudomonas aeruginosa]|uniref:hypothetical protein n=1 Tax=Pseudomonas aeruginosa TaxID=287 RepID=UPI001364B751
MVARSSTLSSVYDIGAAPYRKGQVLHSVFAAALDSQGNVVKNWATSFLFVAIGSAVTLLQNVYKDGLNTPNDVASGDVIVLSILSLITALLFVVSAFVPNEKKKLMKRIGKFFKDSASQNHFIRGAK